MERWRKFAIAVTVLVMLAWTAAMIILFALFLFPITPLEGVVEAAARIRLVILGCWLLGLAVGVVTIVGLWRRVFDNTPRTVRLRLTAAAYAAATVVVLAVFWAEIAGVLLFLGPPLAAALLLLTAWAASPVMRRRLAIAFLAWLIGMTLVGAVWWVSPRTVGVHLWTAWALVTLAATAWWTLPLVRSPTRPPLDQAT